MERITVNLDSFRMLTIAKMADIKGGYFDSKPDIYGHYSSLFIDFKNKTYFMLSPYTNYNFRDMNKDFKFLGDLNNTKKDAKKIASYLVDFWDFKEDKDPLNSKRYKWNF